MAGRSRESRHQVGEMRGRSSVVEHSFSERSVVGSIPIVRSISQSKRILMSFRRFPSLFVMMTTTICDTSGMIPVGGLDLASVCDDDLIPGRSEEHTSELQSLMRISYAV